MKTTTYICDHCKKSVSETDLVSIDTSYQITKQGTNYKSTYRANRDICKSCLDKLGLLSEQPEQDTDELFNKNRKTFETQFIDMLADLGVQFEG